MGTYLNPTNQNFQENLDASIYVDKTGLIELTNGRILKGKEKYVCVSRPRRFGKSMTAGMLVAYYSKGCRSEKLFDGLEISKSADFEKHLNRYNVIRLDITNFIDRAKDVPGVISVMERELAAELKKEYPDIYAIDDHLMGLLQDVYDKTGMPFVFVIDEWDCVFRERRNDIKGQEVYLKFLRNLLKERDYVALCYMTGILPIKKYGEHSALNMFDEMSMTDAGEFAEYTGFTEDEVMALCEKYGRSYDGFKDWYNGYNVEGMAIYNPNSVVQSLRRNKLQSYWTATERYEEISIYIKTNRKGLKDAVVDMLGGKSVPVDVTKFKNDMVTLKSKDDVLTLLIHLGYLTYDAETKTARIPNRELREQFIGNVEDLGWDDVVTSLRSSEELLKATLAMDGEKVASLLDKAHSANTSILRYNDENSLSCVLALAYYSAGAYYEKVREMPTGKGFADFVFIPKVPGYPAMVVELKYDKTANAAMSQIKEKSYADSLSFYKGDIILVGINYSKRTKKHTCVIERSEK